MTQKVVSKAEGRLVPLDPDDLDARRRARRVGVGAHRAPPRRPHRSARPRTGSCARTRASTCRTSKTGWAALLPVDSDRSAKHVRDALRARAGVEVAVIVSDTFGRPWRQGLTDVAIGVSGIAAVIDLRDTPDATGPRAPGHRGRDRRRDRGGRGVGDGQGGGRAGRDRARARPVVVRRGLGARAHPARRTKISFDASASRRSSSAGARSARSVAEPRATAAVLDALVEAACLAPAPHHSRPWRFVVIDTDDAKLALARGMGERWRTDLDGRRNRTAADRRAGRGFTRQDRPARPRSCSAASRGTASTATPTRRASAPSGAWRCCRSAPRSRTSC